MTTRTLRFPMSFLRIKACREILKAVRSNVTKSTRFLSQSHPEATSNTNTNNINPEHPSSSNSSPNNDEQDTSPDDYEIMMQENEETSHLEEIVNVSGLSPQFYDIYHGKPPVLPFKDLARKRKLYAKYGAASGEDPRIMWPSRQELAEMAIDDNYDEVPLHEKIAQYQAEQAAEEKERLERHKMIEKNMAQMSKWISEYQAGVKAAEDEIQKKLEKKDADLEEARDYFGYKIRPSDPKFQQMIEEKEEKEKKEARERKKKEKARKAAERLRQDVMLMGLNPEENKSP